MTRIPMTKTLWIHSVECSARVDPRAGARLDSGPVVAEFISAWGPSGRGQDPPLRLCGHVVAEFISACAMIVKAGTSVGCQVCYEIQSEC